MIDPITQIILENQKVLKEVILPKEATAEYEKCFAQWDKRFKFGIKAVISTIVGFVGGGGSAAYGLHKYMQKVTQGGAYALKNPVTTGIEAGVYVAAAAFIGITITSLISALSKKGKFGQYAESQCRLRALRKILPQTKDPEKLLSLRKKIRKQIEDRDLEKESVNKLMMKLKRNISKTTDKNKKQARKDIFDFYNKIYSQIKAITP